ncbi:MAG: HlyD family efflux transporter periplasmic adaptor subunit [Planctomycetia bacterium]|nr:HlyD family efflux transporter periplasmic adaptor subunit [Planctomycetia bacterium]
MCHRITQLIVLATCVVLWGSANILAQESPNPVEKAPEQQAPTETPAETPAEAPAAAPAEASAEKPAENPPAAPAEAPAEKPAEAPTEAPAEAPAEKPAETPAAAAPAAAQAATEAPAKSYDTFEMKSAPMEINVDADATLWSEELTPIRLSVKQWSVLRVESVVAHGQRVKKGDIIVSFEMEDYNERVQDARLEMELAKLNYQKAKFQQAATLATAKMDAEVSRRKREEALDRWTFTKENDYELTRKTHQATFEDAEFALESQKTELSQLEKMYEADELVEETEELVLRRQRRAVQAAELAFERAKAKYEWNTTRAYDRFIRGEKEKLDRELVAIDLEVAIIDPNLKILEISEKQAEIAFRKAQKKFDELLADAAILQYRAPCDGVVIYGAFENGAWEGLTKWKSLLKKGGVLQANAWAMTIVNPSKMTLSLSIPEREFSKIQSGATGFFVPNAYPEAELRAKITNIADIPDGERYLAWASVEADASLKLFPGMRGKTTFAAIRKSNALLVPPSAIGRDDDMCRYVYILDKETKKPVRRNVKVGLKYNENFEILDGLEAGMSVLKNYKDAE